MFPMPMMHARPIYAIDANTKLLLHFDGTEGGSTFSDSSPAPYTINRTGTPTTRVTQSRFGDTSGLFAGGSNYLTLTDTGKLDFGAGDFTVDWWHWPIALPSGGAPALIAGMTGNDWQISMEGAGHMNLYQRNVNVVIGQPITATLGAWTHHAIVRLAGVVSWYVNGSRGTQVSDSRVLNIASSFQIGNNFNGYMDEIRVSNIARWTSNFIPPGFAYS